MYLLLIIFKVGWFKIMFEVLMCFNFKIYIFYILFCGVIVCNWLVKVVMEENMFS